MRKVFASFLEIIEIIIIAVAAVFIVRTFLVQPFLVSGASMSPNFSNGDYVLVDELTYHIRPPERGEIVVFHVPDDVYTTITWHGASSITSIKNGTSTLVENTDYTVNDNTLAISQTYLAAKLPAKNDHAALTITFNTGDTAVFTIPAIDITNATISPTTADYNINDPKDYGTYFIKRIIGLPGETVLIDNNTVTVFNASNPQGFTLDESYLPAGIITSKNEGSDRYVLSSSTYLMFGDNRPNSFDSRSWGPLSAKDIVGLVRMRLWPLDAIQTFATPKY